jgi:hypothetical protein
MLLLSCEDLVDAESMPDQRASDVVDRGIDLGTAGHSDRHELAEAARVLDHVGELASRYRARVYLVWRPWTGCVRTAVAHRRGSAELPDHLNRVVSLASASVTASRSSRWG